MAVFTPRLQRLMRGTEEPYLRPPMIKKIEPALAAYDREIAASAQPRANPAFSDAWVVGATGGANRAIPQGIDYSRTPCCTAGMGEVSMTPLFVGVVGVPLALFALTVGFDVLKEAMLGDAESRPLPRRNPRLRGKPSVGQRVRYASEWLRSTGQYTGEVPFMRGEVVEVGMKMGNGWYVKVLWDDEDEPQGVLSVNLEKTRR